MKKIKILSILCFMVFTLTRCTIPQIDTNTSVDKQESLVIENNKEITAENCNLNGKRKNNVKVDIGVDFADTQRNYYSYTNGVGQVVYVEAEELFMQNDDTEDVKSTGRYCSDEAKVAGVEAEDLDEGHIIADSLGGGSNSYNITPQDSDTNRHGEQSEMEGIIRDSLYNGKKVLNFEAFITYENEFTMIPSNYKYNFNIGNKEHIYNFSN